MKKLIPFDLEKALAGAQVCYTNGKGLEREDWHYFKNSVSKYPLRTHHFSYSTEGKYIVDGDKELRVGLMLEVDVVEGWANIYKNGPNIYLGSIYISKEEAIKSGTLNCIGQTIIKLEN